MESTFLYVRKFIDKTRSGAFENRKLSVIFLFMDDGSMTLLVALVILVALSAFFSASETAFSSLNQIRLKSRAEDGDTSAARVLAMAEKYDKLLSTILIGNNIVNIAAASIGTIMFTQMLGAERGATVSTMVLTVVVLIFGEVTPKSLAKEMPETVATAVAPGAQPADAAVYPADLAVYPVETAVWGTLSTAPRRIPSPRVS